MNSEEELNKYLKMLSRMKRATVQGYSAPHKPVLLLAVQYMAVMGWLTDNKIYPDKALEGYFAQYWRLKVSNGIGFQELMVSENLSIKTERVYPFNCQIANPFFHLGSEPFWHLIKSDQWELRKNYSLSQLRRFYQYAEIDQPLFQMMKDPPTGRQIRDLLEGMI